MSSMIKTALIVVGMVAVKNQLKKHPFPTRRHLKLLVRGASAAVPLVRGSKIAKIALAAGIVYGGSAALRRSKLITPARYRAVSRQFDRFNQRFIVPVADLNIEQPSTWVQVGMRIVEGVIARTVTEEEQVGVITASVHKPHPIDRVIEEMGFVSVDGAVNGIWSTSIAGLLVTSWADCPRKVVLTSEEIEAEFCESKGFDIGIISLGSNMFEESICAVVLVDNAQQYGLPPNDESTKGGKLGRGRNGRLGVYQGAWDWLDSRREQVAPPRLITLVQPADSEIAARAWKVAQDFIWPSGALILEMGTPQIVGNTGGSYRIEDDGLPTYAEELSGLSEDELLDELEQVEEDLVLATRDGADQDELDEIKTAMRELEDEMNRRHGYQDTITATDDEGMEWSATPSSKPSVAKTRRAAVLVDQEIKQGLAYIQTLKSSRAKKGRDHQDDHIYAAPEMFNSDDTELVIGLGRKRVSSSKSSKHHGEGHGSATVYCTEGKNNRRPVLKRFDVGGAKFFGEHEAYFPMWSALLDKGKQHHIMLVGAPGCGKSTLIREFAHSISASRTLFIDHSAVHRITQTDWSALMLLLGAHVVVFEDLDKAGDLEGMLWMFEHQKGINLLFSTANNPERFPEALRRAGRLGDQIVRVHKPKPDARAALVDDLIRRHKLDEDKMTPEVRERAALICATHAISAVERFLILCDTLGGDLMLSDRPGDLTYSIDSDLGGLQIDEGDLDTVFRLRDAQQTKEGQARALMSAFHVTKAIERIKAVGADKIDHSERAKLASNLRLHRLSFAIGNEDVMSALDGDNVQRLMEATGASSPEALIAWFGEGEEDNHKKSASGLLVGVTAARGGRNRAVRLSDSTMVTLTSSDDDPSAG